MTDKYTPIDYAALHQDISEEKPLWTGSPPPDEPLPPDAHFWALGTFAVVLFLVGSLCGGLAVLVMLP